MEQLIDTLPLAVKIFVKERHPENSEEAADDYWQARKGLNQEKGSGRPLQQTVIKCENCGKKGHTTRDCWSAKPQQPPKNQGIPKPKTEKQDLKDVKCFNCQEKGHYASNCPIKALFCKETRASYTGEMTRQLEKTPLSTGVEREGKVEGKAVSNIFLDTG